MTRTRPPSAPSACPSRLEVDSTCHGHRTHADIVYLAHILLHVSCCTSLAVRLLLNVSQRLFLPHSSWPSRSLLRAPVFVAICGCGIRVATHVYVHVWINMHLWIKRVCILSTLIFLLLVRRTPAAVAPHATRAAVVRVPSQRWSTSRTLGLRSCSGVLRCHARVRPCFRAAHRGVLETTKKAKTDAAPFLVLHHRSGARRQCRCALARWMCLVWRCTSVRTGLFTSKRAAFASRFTATHYGPPPRATSRCAVPLRSQPRLYRQ
jgi:hypothetical protein